ncbi:MAG: hypothetical protein AWU59_1289 [Methanolobus sp. T82-4]|nr:MAG: hypothetical protein AWU59_1289 [Methanolobus sp. T82-4]
MSIFNNLLQLNPNVIPLEDFFTEMFVYLLKVDEDLFYSWIENLKISEIEVGSRFISSQETFDSLENHFSASRPDIFIELKNEDRKEIVLVESKIGSCEGPQQLKRYAEHLDNLENIDCGVLIYITRDYDKKDQKQILSTCSNPDKIQFKQFRWYEIYLFLKSFYQDSGNIFAEEILKFMEEYGLAGDNRFTSVDVLAMSNFSRVRTMMDETMGGQVSDKFKAFAKKVPLTSTCLTQMRDHNRYTFKQDLGTTGFELVLGYFMKSKITDYPDVGIRLGVGPNTNDRKIIIETMKELQSSNPNWKGNNLHETKNWSDITQSMSLDKFMNEDDHIYALQDYFLELLDELFTIRMEFPGLPWD